MTTVHSQTNPKSIEAQAIERQSTGISNSAPDQNPFGAQTDAPPSYERSVVSAHNDNEPAQIRREPSTGERGKEAVPARKGGLSISERFHRISSATGRPINKVAHVVGAEGPWPDTLGRECAKAARILYSFTDLKSDAPLKKGGPLHPTGITKKSVVKIPPKVLQSCHGLAIFNTIRAGGFHGSLSGGSGVIVARRSDGSWSPPSAFLVSTLGAGFMIGLDVYDCVCVLNTPGQVSAFMHPRLSLGGNMGVTVGPVGTGSALNSAVHSAVRPAWTYMKSRGLFLGIQVDGTVFVSRGDANAVFYGENDISVEKILRGDTPWPKGARPLESVLKLIDGRSDYDTAALEDAVGSAPPSPPVYPDQETSIQTAPSGSYAQDGILGEVQAANDLGTEAGRPAHRRKVDDDDMYSTSAVDEKERLARSGY